jgi:HPt (histidine-containing phosphotransfer) domain-containing protein
VLRIDNTPTASIRRTILSIDSISPVVVLDVEGTLARLGGDRQLFLDMTTFLLEDSPDLIAALRHAVQVSNASEIRSKAHALKGLLANSGGVRAAHAAQLLENAGNSRNVDDAPQLLESLESEVESLVEAIHAYRAE